MAVVLSATTAYFKTEKAFLSLVTGLLLLLEKFLIFIFGFNWALVLRPAHRHDTSCVGSHSNSRSVRQCSRYSQQCQRQLVKVTGRGLQALVSHYFQIIPTFCPEVLKVTCMHLWVSVIFCPLLLRCLYILKRQLFMSPCIRVSWLSKCTPADCIGR